MHVKFGLAQTHSQLWWSIPMTDWPILPSPVASFITLILGVFEIVFNSHKLKAFFISLIKVSAINRIILLEIIYLKIKILVSISIFISNLKLNVLPNKA